MKDGWLSRPAVILAVGWYVMAPPLIGPSAMNDLRVDVKAQLSEWTSNGSFDTASECREALAEQTRDLKNRAAAATGTAKNNLRLLALMSQCIATDDPRLKGK